MSPDEINALFLSRKEEMARFIQAHKAELFSVALKCHQTTAVPYGMFSVLEAFCVEFYGRERAFQFAMDHIAEAALLECVEQDSAACGAETFAARLSEVQKSIYPKALSEVTGLSRTTLHSYLAGKTTPPLTRLATMALKVGCRPEWLAFGVGPRSAVV